MIDVQKTIDDLEFVNAICRGTVFADAIELLKKREAKPPRCKECSYHRNDGWCNEHGREVKESDYCSFGAWESR